PVEVLAADLRDHGDGRDLAFAKVVARLIGVSTDDVRKREAIAQSFRIKVMAAAATSFAVLALIAGFLFWERQHQAALNEARESQRVAREQVRDRQLAEMQTLVQSLISVSSAQAAPGTERAVADAVSDAVKGAASGDERYRRALELLKEGRPQEAE